MVIALSVAGFCVLIGVAMCAYPGGHEWDRTTRGHDFWRNYICDLARSTALDGEPNTTSAPIAQVALVALLAGGAAFWWALPALFTRPESRLAGAVRTLGALSLAGVLGVALLPADRFGALHPIAMALSGGPGQAAAIVAVVALDARERIARWTGIVAAISCGVDLGLYAMQLAGRDPGPVVPVLERIAVIAILAWMLVVAWRLRGSG